MKVALEIFLVAVAGCAAFGMLFVSWRRLPVVFTRGDVAKRGFLAALAWLPMWVLTNLIWKSVTGHDSYGYPWWFWLLVVLALAGAVVSLLWRTILGVPRIIGLVLVIAAFFFVGWFGNLPNLSGTGDGDQPGPSPSATSTTSAPGSSDSGSPSSSPSSSTSPPGPTPAVTVTKTPKPRTVTKTVAPPANKLANQLFGKTRPFNGLSGWLRVGTHQIEWTKHHAERGPNAFSAKTLRTPQQVAEFLHGSSAKSRAARRHIVAALRPYGKDEVRRALSGEGYMPVQPVVPTKIEGMSYYQNGKLHVSHAWHEVAAYDVYWLFVTKDGQVVTSASLRADCANPNLERLRPAGS